MGRRIGKIIGIIVAVIIMAGVGYVGYVWSKYQEPEIVDAQIQDEEIKGTISREKLTVVWFEEWKRGHQGWKVPFSYRLKDAKIISIEELEMGYVEVHYQARIPGISRKVVDNLELIGTDEKNVYQGQWVLKWKEKTGGWCIAEAISPVQYQIQSPEFAEEMQRPQTAHYAFDTDKTETYYVQDGVLYVTYDGGENFIEVPDGYETVLCTPNGTYDEYLPENSCLVSSSFTAFIAYENGTTKLLYLSLIHI